MTGRAGGGGGPCQREGPLKASPKIITTKTLTAKTKTRALVIFTLFLAACPCVGSADPSSAKWPMSSVSGVAGAPSQLPCVVTHNQVGDTPTLVLWYKDGARLPFYTLDLREGENKEEFIDPSVKGRARSDVDGSNLILDPLTGADSGQYKCRVDFENLPTLSALVNLTVYVVPSRLVVQNENSQPVTAGLLGPLTEGQKLTLYCVATGGRPLPKVTWWRGDKLLANRSIIMGEDGSLLGQNEVSYSISTDLGTMQQGRNAKHVRTELTIPKLSRDYAHANLTCKASNNHISEPLSTTLSLDVYLRPSDIEIKGPGTPLVEGRQAKVECIASGAYPSSSISWEKARTGEDPVEIKAPSRHLGDRTSSILTLIPDAEDHGAKLTCRAHNPNIPGPGKYKTTTLQVTFAPRVNLRLGANLEGHPITEGKDVYFECEVSCNPQARNIEWHKDGEKVEHQMKAGILVSSRNLVLQMVRRTSAGNYTCTATNTLGTTTSNVVPLVIRYLPVCVSGPQTVAVAEGEDVRLNCQVDAQPDDDLRFTWYFNNTLDTVEVERHRIKVEQGHSFLDYTPRSARDYGTLSCWAANVVGTQADPCRFTVVEAGPPERVGNCVLVNLTVGTLEVECTAGNDGGLPQRFVARVYAAPTHTLLVTLEEETPRFHVEGLTPGQDYLITITAVNDKGSSDPEEIDAVRLKVAEKRMGEVSSPAVSPLVGVFLGLVGGFVFLLIACILLARVRSNKCTCLRDGERERGAGVVGGSSPHAPASKSSGSSRHNLPHSSHDDEDEDSPDVVKTANETAQLLEGSKCPEIIPARRPPPLQS
ncbi:nephrin-like [Macrobrachium rosenbergii]|uniref:nephrin-like n=1 Tax=Macrobrachium rosenbergii TaxID=79674 RepID=UPI0034D3C58B